MFADQGPELVGKDQSWWARTRVGGLRLNLNGGTSYTCNVHVFVRIRVPNAHLGPSKDETPLLALNPPPTQEGCTLGAVCNSEMHCHPRFRPQGNSQCAQPKHYSLITPSVLVPHMG